MKNNRHIIYLVGLLFSLPVALASYINSSFIASFVGEKLVGIVYTASSVFSILFLLLAPKIWSKVGGYKFLLIAASLSSLSFLGLALTTHTFTTALIFILGFSMNTLVVFSLDEILKIFSKDSAIGKIRGKYLAICSVSWVLAQLASGTVLKSFTFQHIYLISFMVMLLFLIITFLKLRNIPDPVYANTNSLKYIKDFFQNKNLARAYIISFLLQFFFSWMIIYTPIYLSSYLHFSWREIGLIFAVMLTPFVFMPFPIGKYGDKFGERNILIWSFTLMTLSVLFMFFINNKDIIIWMLILFTTRLGASSAETMSDSYFFKHIKKENEEWVGVYRSALPFAYILGPLIASMLFYILPSFNYIYLVLGILMLFGVYISSTISHREI